MEETSSLPSVCSEQEELREWRDKLKEQVEEVSFFGLEKYCVYTGLWRNSGHSNKSR